jgi:hypothetical protein
MALALLLLIAAAAASGAVATAAVGAPHGYDEGFDPDATAHTQPLYQ